MIIEWKRMLDEPTNRVIENLNPKIKGWCNYFKIGVSKETFSYLDHWMLFSNIYKLDGKFFLLFSEIVI